MEVKEKAVRIIALVSILIAAKTGSLLVAMIAFLSAAMSLICIVEKLLKRKRKNK